MCNGPILSNMVSFALGVLGTSVLQQLFNTADLLVVGRFGHNGALASVSATSSLINLFINLFVGLSVGAGIVVAKNYGAKDFKEASHCLHTSVAVSVISGIFLAVVVWFLSPIILKAMDTPEKDNILFGAVTYMRIYFIGMPFMLLYNFSASILRAVGDSKRTFFYIIEAGIINVILNLVFVILFDMNVAGVALATTISQAYSSFRCLNCFIHYDGYLRFEWKRLKIYKRSLISIAKVGIPSGIQSSLFSLSNVLIQSSVNSFGSAAMEGTGAASNVESYLYFVSNAMSNTVTNFTSQNFGASKPERIKKVGLYGFAVSASICTVLSVLVFILANPLLSIFKISTDAITYGKQRMIATCLTLVICSAMEITTGLLRGIFKPTSAMVSSVLGICVFRIIWVKTIFEKYHYFWVLYLSYPISWFLSFIIQGILVLHHFRKYEKSVFEQRKEKAQN